MLSRPSVALRHRASVLAVLAASALLIGCGDRPPTTPSAVISATPGWLCAQGPEAQIIELNGFQSAQVLTLIPTPADPDAPPLTWGWSFSGAAFEVIEGDVESPELAVSVANDRPLHVRLVVRTEEGGEADAVRTIPLTRIEPPPACTEGACDAGQTCLERSGDAVCVPDVPCTSDSTCPACWSCNREVRLCVPPEGA